MSDDTTRRRSEYLREKLGLAEVVATRIEALQAFVELCPHNWAGNGTSEDRCTVCLMTRAEGHTSWPGQGSMPCLGYPTRN